MSDFIGRKHELKLILDSFSSRKGVLNVIQGRRRIGKTRLIKELANQKKKITLRYLTSPPPKKEISDKQERKSYAEQIQKEFGLPYLPVYDTWANLIYFIVSQCNDKNTIIAIDEINWLAKKSDIPIESILWQVWERECAQKKNFMLILSGSLASWIETNIISYEGFVGRISHKIILKELTLSNVRSFFGSEKNRLPNRDLIKLLCAFGCIPLYLELINPKLSAEDNLKKLAYDKSGPLNNEFNQMFNSLFSDENKVFRSILEIVGLSNSLLQAKEIAEKIGKHYTGRINETIAILCQVGFLKEQTNWNTKTKKEGSIYRYQIADNYTAFFFRSINKQTVKNKLTKQESLPENLANILGLQFENLVENNSDFILDKIGIKQADYVGSYFQTKTQRQEGCQVDLLIQTRYRIYICECKLLGDEVNKSIIEEVKNKIRKITAPKGITLHPVLVHANGVAASVEESSYFDHIIDLTDALEP